MIGDLSVAAELVAGVALAVQLGCVVVVGALVGQWIGGADRLLAWLVGALCAVCHAVAVPLLLGAAGVLHLPTVVGGHIVILAVSVAWRRRSASTSTAAGDVAVAGPGLGTIASRVAIGGSAAYLLLAVMLSLGPPSSDTDTREYHVTNLATWLNEANIWELPYQSSGGVSSTHPGDAELLGLWLSLPTHGDEIAYLMPTCFVALALLGAAVLARELARSRDGGGDESAAARGTLAALAVATAPIYLTTQVASLSTDITVAACTVVALALLLVARRTTDTRLVAAAGAALGLAVGSKYTALVPVAVLTLAALWVVPRRRDWWWLVPGVAVLALPWYIRNLAQTGNPIFPQPFGPFAGGESPYHVIDTTMLDHLRARDREIVGDWVEHVARRIGPVVAVAGVGSALALRGGRGREARRLVAVVTVAAFVGYLAIPFSGGGPTGLAFLIVSSLRYSLTAVLLGAVCWSALAGPRLVAWALGAVAAWNLWQLRSAIPFFRPDVSFGDARLASVVLVGLVVVLVTPTALRLVRPIWEKRTMVACGALAVAALASASVFHRYDRGDTNTALEAALLRYGADEPVVVMGVLDLRSMLGPRLERPLVGASRGGEVGEIPFATASQVRRLILEDATAPAAPASFGPALDAAIERTGAELLVVGPLGQAAYPEGWTPERRWCPVVSIGAITVYATGEVLASTGSGC